MGQPRLQGLSIVIIGGTSGLGLSAARACHREGAHLTIVGRPAEDLDQIAASLDLASGVMAADAADPSAAEKAVQHAVSTYGRLDGLFHVAGGSGRRVGDGPLDRIPDDGWHQTMDANVSSLFYSNRAAVREFLRAGTGGSILNMGSVLGFSPAPMYFATHAYAAAKAAVIGLTTSCAAYYAGHGIRFNVVAPSLMRTPGAERAAQDPQIVEYVQRKQPLDGGRIGVPEDVDGAVVFFLSQESRFVTGQVLAVDGGWTVSDPWQPSN